MFTVEDNDLPITVAQKIIAGTKPINEVFTNSLNRLVGGDGTQDMFSIEDIKEIIEYLQVYLDNHRNGD